MERRFHSSRMRRGGLMRHVIDGRVNRPWEDLLEEGSRLLDGFCWIGMGYALAVILFQLIRFFAQG